MRAASSEPTMRRRGRIARPISSARASPRPVPALSLACLLLALFVPVREVSATRAFGSPAPVASAPGIIAAEGGRFVDPSDGSTFHVAGANCYYLVYSSGADEGSYVVGDLLPGKEYYVRVCARNALGCAAPQTSLPVALAPPKQYLPLLR